MFSGISLAFCDVWGMMRNAQDVLLLHNFRFVYRAGLSY